MSILIALLIGLAVGMVAKVLIPGPSPGGIVMTSVLGIAGSMLAFYAGRDFGWFNNGSSVGFIASVLGAIAILLVYRFINMPGRSNF
ncbi:MAG: GlsB/YeaQ/YmgE family stress response membrane protein [Proteobacteria bacterium]|jgi:uncharacterized membrane protein YeaQ/YmgE (transglycosylase-associated protein family)|nr:GlsB/YeaQ/YmgE family stress response membrane protein [Pseudomonadota bacterium]